MASKPFAAAQPKHNDESGTSGLPHNISETPQTAYRLHLTSDVAEQLGRYITPIVATLRTAFDDRAQTQGDDEDRRLTIDLSDASNVPSAQLLLLVNLLRRVIGGDLAITLSGVKPMNLGPLVAFDLPRGVVVIDSRGRRWAR